MTEAEYNLVIARIEQLIAIDPDRESDEGFELEVLANKVETYEKKHYPIDKPTVEEVLKFRMEQDVILIQ